MTARLTSGERDEFEDYARRFHLDAAGLLALLFARELRVGRLGELVQEDTPPDAIKDDKVTFRIARGMHAAVVDHVKDRSTSVSAAGAALIRAELAERWLERVIPTRLESSAHV